MKRGLLVTLFLSLTLILAACGGSEQSSTDDSGNNQDEAISNTLDVKADNFTFGKEKFVVQSGEEVKVNFSNKEGMHGFAIDNFDVNIKGEGSATFTPTEPGEYEIYCSVPCGEGHEDMTATLVVK